MAIPLTFTTYFTSPAVILMVIRKPTWIDLTQLKHCQITWPKHVIVCFALPCFALPCLAFLSLAVIWCDMLCFFPLSHLGNKLFFYYLLKIIFLVIIIIVVIIIVIITLSKLNKYFFLLPNFIYLFIFQSLHLIVIVFYYNVQYQFWVSRGVELSKRDFLIFGDGFQLRVNDQL